jgi:hypothetical protein
VRRDVRRIHDEQHRMRRRHRRTVHVCVGGLPRLARGEAMEVLAGPEVPGAAATAVHAHAPLQERHHCIPRHVSHGPDPSLG